MTLRVPQTAVTVRVVQTPESIAAANVAKLRDLRRMTVRDLSARLDELGHPVLPSGITKIEKSADDRRRIDVGDLIALALALDVNPTRIFLPTEGDPYTTEVQLTPNVSALLGHAWLWAEGTYPLPRTGAPADRLDWESDVLPPWQRDQKMHSAVRAGYTVVHRIEHYLNSVNTEDRQDALRLIRTAIGRLVAEIDDLEAHDGQR